MSHIAVAAYNKSPQAEPALALSIDGQVYDLEDVRKAGVELDGAFAGNSVPSILARWDRGACDIRRLPQSSSLAQTGKLKPVADAAAKLTAPLSPGAHLLCRLELYRACQRDGDGARRQGREQAVHVPQAEEHGDRAQ